MSEGNTILLRDKRQVESKTEKLIFFSELSEGNTILLGDKRQVESLLRGLQQEIDDLLIRCSYLITSIVKIIFCPRD